MTSGGWHSQEQRHGRHRQGATGAAWTPAVRPTDAAPAHARRDGFGPVMRPSDTAPPVSEVLTRRPGWPVEPEVPAARRAAEIGRAWPAQRERRSVEPAWPSEDEAASAPPAAPRPEGAPRGADGPEGAPRSPDRPESAPHGTDRPEGAPRGAGPARGGPSRQPAAQESPQGVVPVAFRRPEGRHVAPPERRAVSVDMVPDTVPNRPVMDVAVVHTLSETTATGLRKFDLGNVPASVTPPRSWRRAAWFAVGTSAAVVLGLTIAAVELMGRPVSDGSIIDAMPAFPTGQLTLEQLPNERTTTDLPGTRHTRPTTPSRERSSVQASPVSQQQELPQDTVIGSTTDGYSSDAPGPSDPPSQGTTSTTPNEPNRRTVGPAPVTPTDPQAMGDRTEEYFRLVTTDPAAAHAMTTGGMAREGAEGIEARYVGVRRVEVQDITIDRNLAITTSTVKIVREDGTESIEHRQLTFTWGGDPKITEDATTG